MRVLVVGGGAIGGITAAGLDADVIVLDANEEHVAALRDPGLVINDERAGPAGRRRAVDELDGEFDFALVAVKSPLHHVALAAAGRARRDRRVRLDGQRADPGPHGGDRRRGQPARLHRRVGRLERRPGRAGPRLARRLHGRRARRHRSRERARELAAALEPVGAHAGDRQRARDDLVQAAGQLTFTGLSAVSGLRYGGVAEQGRDAVFALWKEGVRSATRRAWSWARSTTSTRTASTRPRSRDEMEPANVRPSMLQDLDAGRDDRGRRRQRRRRRQGARARDRRRRATTRVVELVHSIERGERVPEPRWLRYVSDAQTISATDS